MGLKIINSQLSRKKGGQTRKVGIRQKGEEKKESALHRGKGPVTNRYMSRKEHRGTPRVFKKRARQCGEKNGGLSAKRTAYLSPSLKKAIRGTVSLVGEKLPFAVPPREKCRLFAVALYGGGKATCGKEKEAGWIP